MANKVNMNQQTMLKDPSTGFTRLAGELATVHVPLSLKALLHRMSAPESSFTSHDLFQFVVLVGDVRSGDG